MTATTTAPDAMLMRFQPTDTATKVSRATLTRTSLARLDSLSVTPWMASEIVLVGRVMAMPLTDNCASRAALV